MNEIDILQWAAGSPQKLPSFENIDDDRILYLLGIDQDHVERLIEHHRLAGRFLNRFREERPGWCSRSLLARVIKQNAIAYRQVALQLKAVREISQALEGTCRPLVVIKGYTTYALTGAVQSLRLSSDLDLFYGDLEYLYNVLVEIGYTGQILPDLHEYAKLSRGDVFIELHRYLPVLSYPAGIWDTVLDPKQNQGAWVQTLPDTRETKLQYEDLLASVTHGRTPDTRDLCVPDVVMSILVICAHLFKHATVVQPANGDIPIKLAELAEIRELAAHPEYDAERLHVLAGQYDGYDAISFVNSLFGAYFGDTPLPTRRGQTGKIAPVRFPRCLSWWKCWADYISPHDLLLPADISSLIEYLEPEVVLAKEGRIYTVGIKDQGKPIRRFVLHTAHGNPIPVWFSIHWGTQALTFTICLPEPLPEQSEEVSYHIKLRGGRYFVKGIPLDIDYAMDVNPHFTGNSPAGVGTWSEEPHEMTLTVDQEGLTLRFGLPWNRFSPHVRLSKAINLALTISIRDTRHFFAFAFDPVLIIPLRVMRD